jgi:high-affinity iron transporter
MLPVKPSIPKTKLSDAMRHCPVEIHRLGRGEDWIRNIFLQIVFVLCLATTISPLILAQELPAWQAAEAIRQHLFQAQTEMFAAARADSPQTHYDTAATLVEQTAILYADTLQAELAGVSPPADQAITEALDQARVAARQGQALEFASARGRLWPNLMWGSYEAILATIESGDADAAAAWLRLREYRQATKVTVVDDISTQTITALAAGNIEPGEALGVIGADLRDAYFFRLREALNRVEDNIQKGFTVRAAEWAGQARGYLNILQADIARKQGHDAAEQLTSALAALEQATLAEDNTAVMNHLADIRAMLAGYSPVELSPAEVEKRGQLLYLFTDLIYIEYKNGVRNGQITIPIEYQEAITFRDQAEAVFEEVRPLMAATDGPATERYAQLLTEMESIMAGLGEADQIKVKVEEALGLVEQTLAVSADANDTGSALVVINTLFDDIVLAANEGRYDDAERSRLEAYAMFENGMEQRLANRAIGLSRELEGLFWEGSGGQKGLATLLQEQAGPEDVQANIDRLRTRLDAGQSLLAAGLTGLLAAANSLAIIIREGLEAVLIIGAILGYMRATKAPARYSTWIYIGIVTAILLSIGTWWAAKTIITISVAGRELIEGITSLLAVAVLFYVTNWLFHKVYVIDWLTFVKEQVNKAVGHGSAVALAALGFTVVYREGFETVLFYQALLFDAEPGWVWLGFVVGSIIILVVAFAILRMSKRLPLKPFFTITGILLLLLAFSLTGKGVRELQEAGVIGATLLPWLPENLLLMELFGLFPTLETTAAQALLSLAIAVTFVISLWQGQRKPAARTAASRN